MEGTKGFGIIVYFLYSVKFFIKKKKKRSGDSTKATKKERPVRKESVMFWKPS